MVISKKFKECSRKFISFEEVSRVSEESVEDVSRKFNGSHRSYLSRRREC